MSKIIPFLKRKTQHCHKCGNHAFITKREKSICKTLKLLKTNAQGFWKQSKSQRTQYFGLSELCSCASLSESESYRTICCRGVYSILDRAVNVDQM